MHVQLHTLVAAPLLELLFFCVLNDSEFEGSIKAPLLHDSSHSHHVANARTWSTYVHTHYTYTRYTRYYDVMAPGAGDYYSRAAFIPFIPFCMWLLLLFEEIR